MEGLLSMPANAIRRLFSLLQTESCDQHADLIISIEAAKRHGIMIAPLMF